MQAVLPLETAPEDPPRNLTNLRGVHPLQGAEIANLSPALTEELNFNGPATGVIILNVARGSQAQRFGARPGDVILTVNEEPVARVQDVEPKLVAVQNSWLIRLRRANGSFRIQASRNR